MRIIKSLSAHSFYLLINALVFLLGYIFILKSYSVPERLPKYAILLSIGTSLIASGIVALLDLWKEMIKDKLLDKVRGVITEGGIDFVYEKRDLDKYDVLMKSLKDKLDITGYTLNAFYESYSDLLVDKAQNNAGLSVRILLIDPESEFSKHRANLEDRTVEAFKNSVERIRKKFADYKNIEIRLIDTPLTTMIFRIDDVMFVGPHFYKKPSKSTITFELNQKGWVFREFEREFERLWNDARVISPNPPAAAVKQRDSSEGNLS